MPGPLKDAASGGRWTNEEHDRFLQGMSQFGRRWTKIAEVVGTRTTIQVRSHAQKWEIKAAKESDRPSVPVRQASAHGSAPDRTLQAPAAHEKKHQHDAPAAAAPSGAKRRRDDTTSPVPYHAAPEPASGGGGGGGPSPMLPCDLEAEATAIFVLETLRKQKSLVAVVSGVGTALSTPLVTGVHSS